MAVSDQATASVQRRKWLLIGGAAGAAGLIVIGVGFAARSTDRIPYVLVWGFFVAVLFNIVTALAAWLFTKSARRVFLRGRFPVSIGIAKLVVLISLVMLILMLVGGFAIGPPYEAIATRAFALGMLGSGDILLAANGALNAIIVVRHFRGTLSSTSRVA